MSDLELVQRFKTDPEAAFQELLDKYTSVLLRMIRNFMKDPDEVMEVYTNICERLAAHDYQALRRFHSDGELTPWLSVVVANACRDRFRKRKASSVPQSVLDQLDEREKLIFKYYYQDRLPHEDIAELVSRRHGIDCSALQVVDAVAKINALLSTRKRWLLLSALNANRPTLSIDELSETGFEPASETRPDRFDESARQKALVQKLSDALGQLTPEDRLLVLLRFEHDRSAPQIAALLHFENHKYVYTRLRTVVKQLRRLMGMEAA